MATTETPEAPKPVGRPSSFTQEIADTICQRMAEGQSLRQVCRDPAMPSTSAVLRWAREREEFRQQYTQAREDLLEHWADDIVDISDDSSDDTIVDERGNARPNSEWITRSRLRVDTRKWLMSKLKPRVYGDRSAVEMTGKDGKDLVPVSDDAEIARRVLFMLQKGAAAAETPA